jgi:HNH endonuclease
MWTLIHEEIPAGQVVRHKCDNPLCINTDHLELGTQKENMRDMIERGRGIKKRKGLSEQVKMEITNSKQTIKQLAIIYGVSHSTINSLRKKRTDLSKVSRAPNKPSVMGTKCKTKPNEIKKSSNK